MIRQLFPVSALLFGSALLLFAGGMHSLILPVRGVAEGFSSTSLGLLGTGWAVGYVLGCLYVPRMVGSVGHIRTFGVMCAFAAVAILLQALVVRPEVWIPVRAVSGFCFAGAAMIVESWLSDRANPQNRGRIFGIYTMVNLGATTAGQMAIALGDASGFLFFAVAAIVYSLALVPTALSTSASPAPLTSVRLNLPLLWRNSPVAVAACFLVGISNGSFGTLAAVYAGQVGLTLSAIALFSSIPVLAGALAQIPVGYASDRMDRRKVLVLVAVVALAADLGFLFATPQDQLTNLILVSVFGAAIYSMYPILIAHANDHAPQGTAIQVSGGLLMVFGVGNIIGPLIAGVAMGQTGAQGLFLTTVVGHVVMILYTLRRITKRAAVKDKDKTKKGFQITIPAKAATPETMVLAEGEEEGGSLEEAMAEEDAAQARSSRTEPTE
ncbi:MFS transporter [Maliponia aquimaris]|uniref:Putative MFS-type transporter YcaD n=1 Tax=Maliponia aquimaris TaxID=1673631 RepID=A0A238KX22_9RHOB|nr:MFS transporter [Maliponia aquimaris]SMX46762.1 putative MFS-type transporter YcaD [Maliponia aquimaris]